MIGVSIYEDMKDIYYYNWLSNKTYRNESFVEGKKEFLLLPLNSVDAFFSTPLADAAKEVYRDRQYVIYDFEHPKAVWYALQK